MQNKKQIIIFLVIAFVLVFIITLGANSLTKNSTVKTGVETNTVPTKTLPTPKKVSPDPILDVYPLIPSYTLAQVATHKNASSCWTIVGLSVYDVTPWINKHPGGAQAILGLCGRDGTTDFLAQHGGQTQPEKELNTFQIGTYKK